MGIIKYFRLSCDAGTNISATFPVTINTPTCGMISSKTLSSHSIVDTTTVSKETFFNNIALNCNLSGCRLKTKDIANAWVFYVPSSSQKGASVTSAGDVTFDLSTSSYLPMD
jgi:hypothetical protein